MSEPEPRCMACRRLARHIPMVETKKGWHCIKCLGITLVTKHFIRVKGPVGTRQVEVVHAH